MSEDYIESYGDLGVHFGMLLDEPRVDAYARALTAVMEALRKRGVERVRVLDVGCGATAILSLLAARAGADEVVGVEANGDAARLAAQVVQENALGDKVRIEASNVEQFVERHEKSKDAPFDVLVSEWMGHYLVHESMLDSVLVARRLLKADGLMLPDAATLYAAPVHAPRFFGQRRGVARAHGFSFDALVAARAVQLAAAADAQQPLVVSLNDAGRPCMLAEPQSVTRLDLRAIDASALDCIRAQLHFTYPSAATTHGVAFFFDVSFPCCDAVLSTSPAAAATHWAQTLLLFPDACAMDAADYVPCHVTLARKAGERAYEIDMVLDEL